jgi:hypothetical protein
MLTSPLHRVILKYSEFLYKFHLDYAEWTDSLPEIAPFNKNSRTGCRAIEQPMRNIKVMNELFALEVDPFSKFPEIIPFLETEATRAVQLNHCATNLEFVTSCESMIKKSFLGIYERGMKYLYVPMFRVGRLPLLLLCLDIGPLVAKVFLDFMKVSRNPVTTSRFSFSFPTKSSETVLQDIIRSVNKDPKLTSAVIAYLNLGCKESLEELRKIEYGYVKTVVSAKCREENRYMSPNMHLKEYYDAVIVHFPYHGNRLLMVYSCICITSIPNEIDFTKSLFAIRANASRDLVEGIMIHNQHQNDERENLKQETNSKRLEEGKSALSRPHLAKCSLLTPIHILFEDSKRYVAKFNLPTLRQLPKNKIIRQRLNAATFALEEANANERKEGVRVTGYDIVKLSKLFHDAKISDCHVLCDDSASDDLTLLEAVIKKKYSVAVLRNFAIRYQEMTVQKARNTQKNTTKSDGLGVKSRGIAIIVAE